MADLDPQTLLFFGAHVPGIRFERALARLDLSAALHDAPRAWRGAVEELAAALGSGPPKRADLDRLVAARRADWPEILERTWQRLVGLRLAATRVPGGLEGEPAAAFLLRGGEEVLAKDAAQRHLDAHPTDAAAWALWGRWEPVRGAARCGFHGGPVLAGVEDLVERIETDENAPVGLWLLAYAWFAGELNTTELKDALTAEGLGGGRALPFAGSARAFTAHLVEVESNRAAIAARRRMKKINPAAFQRYLAVIG